MRYSVKPRIPVERYRGNKRDSREHANRGQTQQALGSEFGKTFEKEEIHHKNSKRE